MVPGGGLSGILGVEIGKAAALVSAVPGADVHELPGVELPGDGTGVTVPVVLPATEPTIVTGMAVGKVGKGLVIAVIGAVPDPAIVVAPIGLVEAVGVAETVVFVDVTLITEGDSSTVIAAQLKLVPGIVGSCANGGEAKVVAGAPGTVAAEKRLENGLGPVSGDDTTAPGVVGTPMEIVPMLENGLGPVSGDDTTAPGVVGIPIEVVPMVDTCAHELPPPSRSTAVTQRTVRIQICSGWSRRGVTNSQARRVVRLCCRRRDLPSG
jgi:hypothetical protein